MSRGSIHSEFPFAWAHEGGESNGLMVRYLMHGSGKRKVAHCAVGPAHAQPVPQHSTESPWLYYPPHTPAPPMSYQTSSFMVSSAGPGHEYPNRAAPSAEMGLPQFRCISRGSTHVSGTDDRGSTVSCASCLQDLRQPLERGMPTGQAGLDWNQAGLHYAAVPPVTHRSHRDRGNFDYSVLPPSVAVHAPRSRIPAHLAACRRASGSVDMVFSDTESDCDTTSGVRTPPRHFSGRCGSPSGAVPVMTISISGHSGPPSPPCGIRDLQFLPGIDHRYLPGKRPAADPGAAGAAKALAAWDG